MAQFIDESLDNSTDEVSNIVEDQQTADEANVDNQPQEEEIPERYKGKSPTEIIRMHQEA